MKTLFKCLLFIFNTIAIFYNFAHSFFANVEGRNASSCVSSNFLPRIVFKKYLPTIWNIVKRFTIPTPPPPLLPPILIEIPLPIYFVDIEL